MNIFKLKPNHVWGYTEPYLKAKMPSELYSLMLDYIAGKTGGVDDTTGDLIYFDTDICRLISWYNEKMNEPNKKGKII